MKYLLSGPTTSHAPVDFGDEGTAVICFSRIVEASIGDGRCRVNWDDGEEYNGDLIITGRVNWDDGEEYDGDLIITGKTGYIKLQQYNSPAILFLDRQTIVTGFAKTILKGTFCILRYTNLKY